MNKIKRSFTLLITYSSIITLTLLLAKCSTESIETNDANIVLISHKWSRDSYVNKNTLEIYKNFKVKSEFQFFPNGNLLIKEPQYIESPDSGSLAPPPGSVDTLYINGKWSYSKTHGTLTLLVDEDSQIDTPYNYTDWKLTSINGEEFEIENTQGNNSSETLRVHFKNCD